ncbi:hypothetical protein C0992_008879, partial [Termitomyces sp. T32_za158]
MKIDLDLDAMPRSVLSKPITEVEEEGELAPILPPRFASSVRLRHPSKSAAEADASKSAQTTDSNGAGDEKAENGRDRVSVDAVM